MSSTDPRNWVTNPPQTLVKVINTSRPAINNAFGIVVGYASDRNRYVVHLCVSQQQVSLQPDNLQKCNMLESLQAQWQLLKHDPRAQAQLQNVLGRVQSWCDRFSNNYITVKPEYLVGAILFLLVSSIYFLGFSKTLFLLSLFMLAGVMIVPTLINDTNATWQSALQQVPSRFRETLRTQVPVVGPRIANNKYLSAAVAAIFMYACVSVLIPRNTRFNKLSSPTTPLTSSTLYTGSDSSNDNLLSWQDAYKLGFEDAQNGRSYGMSLPTKAEPSHSKPKVVDSNDVNLDDWEWPETTASSDYTASSKRSRRQPLTSKLNLSTLLSVGYLGKQINDLGRMNGMGAWSFHEFKVNVMHLDPMRMGFLALAVYRVVRVLI